MTRLRSLVVFLWFATLAIAQVSVCNPSALRQARWFVAPMPAAMADVLPEHCVVGRTWLATKAERIADHTQLWHVRADVAGHSAGPLGAWAPLTVPFPPMVLSPWITDAVEKMTPVVMIRVAGTLERVLVPTSVTFTRSSAACFTWHLKGSAGGWHAEFWAKTFSGQDVVDLRGFVLWSNPTVREWKLPNVTVNLRFGEPFALYFAKRSGFEQLAPNSWRIYSGELPHGTAIPVRGAILPQDDTRPNPNAFDMVMPGEPARSTMTDELRREWLQAGAQAPLVAACDWRGYPWLGFGLVPTVSQREARDPLLAYLEQPGDLFAGRPLANNPSTGDTGSQACFGATKDLVALQGDPWRVWALLYSADDYLLRGRHHRELDGSRITRATRPQFDTWMGCIESRAGTDRLGRDQGYSPEGWDEIHDASGEVLRRVPIDDQHRGGAYVIATYALTGDEALREDLLDGLAVDENRAFPKRGWLDSPRASGRLMQEWAKLAMVFKGDTRERLRALALAELAQREAVQPLGSPVSPSDVMVDPRILPDNQPAWVPWNNALEHLGELEQWATWTRLGDEQLAVRFRTYVVRQATNNLQWGALTSSSGVDLGLGGVLWHEGNDNANPPDYYTFPREGAHNGPGGNMLVLSPGWWPWFAGTVGAVLEGEAAGEAHARAVRVVRDFYLPATDLSTAEWIAIGRVWQ